MADPIQTPPATPPVNDPNGGQPPANDPGKTLTQAEIDAIVEERLAREKKKYADYGDLKKAAAELAELKKSQMSEMEKLKADLAEKDTLLQAKDQELSGLKLERVKADLEELGQVEQMPKMEGREMIMVIAPKKNR